MRPACYLQIEVPEYLGFDDIADQTRILQSKMDEASQQIQQLTDTDETTAAAPGSSAVQGPASALRRPPP